MSAGTDPNDLAPAAFFDRYCAGDLVERLLAIARDEDLGAGGLEADVSSRVSCEPGESGSALMVVREACVVAGVAALASVARVFGAAVDVQVLVEDGRDASRGDAVARLAGRRAHMLGVERTMLNLVGRLSGVATTTSRFVRALRDGAPGCAARLFDTRKTTPGLRVLEKYAVRCGGGCCHRMGLHDAVMLKDNHLAGLAADALGARVLGWARRAGESTPRPRFVEVEVDSLEQLRAVLRGAGGAVDVILLDNMDDASMARAVEIRDESAPGVLLEASGGVTEDRIASIAKTGVDRISTGSVTHASRWIDVGLDHEDQSGLTT